MNYTKVYTGILLGAAVGSTVALLDKTTRQKTGQRLKKLQYYSGRPSEAVRDLRVSYERIAGDFSQKTDDVLKLLSTIQETIDMIDTLTGKGSSKDLTDNTRRSDSIK